MNLLDFFTQNHSPRQKQYETLRAAAFNQGSLEDIAARFGYTVLSLRVLIHRLLSGKHPLFPEVKRGPKKKPTFAIEPIRKEGLAKKTNPSFLIEVTPI